VLCAALIGLLALVPALLLWTQHSRFPQQVATHWNARGLADGFMSLNGAILTGGLLSLAIPLILVAMGTALGATRPLAAVGVGTAAFMSCLSLGSLWTQRDAMTPDIGPVLSISTTVGLVLGLLTWILLRAVGRHETRPSGPLASGIREVRIDQSTPRQWHGTTKVGRGVVWGMSTLALVIALAAVATAIWAAPWVAPILGLCALITIMFLLLMRLNVSIDDSGVSARTLGLRLIDLPLDEITGVGLTQVDALGDYGGWGWRLSLDGRSQGVVTASGTTLVIEREDRRDMVLVLEDAEAAAATLTALIRV